MMTTIVARAWQSVKPHLPLIKFRKGAISHAPPQVVPGASPAVQASAARPNLKPTQAAPSIYDWQLPAKYRRQPLSQQEVDVINRGGPE